MLAGDITGGRLLGRGLRARLIGLRQLLAAPYLLLIASRAAAVAVVPVAAAYSATARGCFCNNG